MKCIWLGTQFTYGIAKSAFGGTTNIYKNSNYKSNLNVTALKTKQLKPQTMKVQKLLHNSLQTVDGPNAETNDELMSFSALESCSKSLSASRYVGYLHMATSSERITRLFEGAHNLL